MMTRKDFIELADIVRPYLDTLPSGFVGALVDFCRKQNPAFKSELWLPYLKGEAGPRGGMFQIRSRWK